MEVLENLVKLFEIVVPAIKTIKGVECFAPAGWNVRESRPKFFAFDRQIPFARQPREFDFPVRVIGRNVERRAPEGIEFSIGAGLA